MTRASSHSSSHTSSWCKLGGICCRTCSLNCRKNTACLFLTMSSSKFKMTSFRKKSIFMKWKSLKNGTVVRLFCFMNIAKWKMDSLVLKMRTMQLMWKSERLITTRSMREIERPPPTPRSLSLQSFNLPPAPYLPRAGKKPWETMGLGTRQLLKWGTRDMGGGRYKEVIITCFCSLLCRFSLVIMAQCSFLDESRLLLRLLWWLFF